MLSAGLNKVIVKIMDNPKMSPGGIEIPDIAKTLEPQKKGVRAMVNDWSYEAGSHAEKWLNACGMSEGAMVHVPLIGGIKIRHEGEELVVYPIEDILAVVS